MSWRQVLQRLRGRDRVEAELDAELRDHVERQVADYVQTGMPVREARRRARLEFGGLDQVKELCRDARGARWIEDISRDLRHAFRRLARDRSLVTLAVTTLGLGIGLNVTVFAMVHAIFVRGLPYDDPGRIVNVWSNSDRSSRYQRVSLPDFEDYRRGATTLAGLAAFTVDDRMSLSDAEHAPAPLNGSLVTANTFRLLGQPVLLGRDFLPADGRRGAERTVILGHRVWRDRYAADPDVVGRVVRVDGEPSTVIGVMPHGVRFPFRAELWRALQPTETLERRDARRLATVGRLRRDVDLEEAQAELSAIAGGLRLAHPETNESTGASVQTFNDWATGSEVRLIYLALTGAVAFVLLIACANVANLLIARSAQRAHEVAIRLAQGATRWQIVRQLSMESLLLGGAGGVAGLGVAAGSVRLAGYLTRDLGIPPWMRFTIDIPTLTFLTGLCVLTTLLFGLAPLLHLAGAPVGRLLQEGGRSGSHGIRARRLSAAMIAVEAALALVLLGGTGLMLRSLDKMYRIDLGFDPERVLQGEIALPSRQYADPEEQIRFATQLQRDLNASPGVRAASVVRTRTTTMIEVDGRPAPEELPAAVFVMSVGSRHFEVLGARVLRGRALADDDGHAGAEAAVVNERFAALFFGAEGPPRPADPDPGPGRLDGPLADHRRHRVERARRGRSESRLDSGRTPAVPHGRRLLARPPYPDRGRPPHVRAAVESRRARARPRPAGAPRAADGGHARGGALVVPRAERHARRVRPVRRRPRRGGDLRRRGLFGGAANAGDRDSHRARRAGASDSPDRARPGARVRRRRAAPRTGRRRRRRPGDREPAHTGPSRRPADPGARAAAVRRAGRRRVRGSGAPGRFARSVRCAPFRVTHSVRRRAAHTVRPATARAGSRICMSGLVTVLRSSR